MELPVMLSPGKQKGLEALSTERGIIAALAIDQRSALRRLFAKASGCPPEEIRAASLSNFKSHVSRILTPHASAILLDPEFGFPAAAARAPKAGLLLAYEQTGYDKFAPGRLPRLLENLTAAKLREAGGDAIKVLLYFSPFSTIAVNSYKFAWVERIGQECIAADVPFFLELVSYHDDMDEKGPEFARIKPDVVVRSVEEFCKPRYAVDIIKVGVPVNMNFVYSSKIARDESLYTRDQAAVLFRRASDACSLPFIYLSEGVSNEVFVDALELAAEAGSAFSGVLCGRATWQDGVSIMVQHGESALDAWLEDQGVKNIQNVNARLVAAHSWHKRRTALSERTA